MFSASLLVHLHPICSAVATGTLFVVVVFELARVLQGERFKGRDALPLLQLLLALTAAAAFFSGYRGAEEASKSFVVGRELIEQHHSLGRLFFILAAATAVAGAVSRAAVYQRTFFRSLYLVLLAGAVCSGIVAGYMGGSLVFEHGAGVSATAP